MNDHTVSDGEHSNVLQLIRLSRSYWPQAITVVTDCLWVTRCTCTEIDSEREGARERERAAVGSVAYRVGRSFYWYSGYDGRGRCIRAHVEYISTVRTKSVRRLLLYIQCRKLTRADVLMFCCVQYIHTRARAEFGGPPPRAFSVRACVRVCICVRGTGPLQLAGSLLFSRSK